MEGNTYFHENMIFTLFDSDDQFYYYVNGNTCISVDSEGFVDRQWTMFDPTTNSYNYGAYIGTEN